MNSAGAPYPEAALARVEKFIHSPGPRKTWSASFFSNRPRAFAPSPSRTMADRVQGNPELRKKKKKKHEGFKRPRRRAFHWGDIEFSRVWRGGDLPSIMIRPSFPHDLPATGFEGATEVGPAWWIITCGILSSVFRWDVSMKVSPLVSQLRRGRGGVGWRVLCRVGDKGWLVLKAR